MGYFTGYFSDYFAVGETVQVESKREVYGHAPTLEEWREYLRRLNESQKDHMAAMVADRQSLRKIIRDQLIPAVRTEVKPQAKPRVEPKKEPPKQEVRQIRLPYIPDAEPELRKQVAKLILEIRRKARKRRRRRQEEALLMLVA